MAIETIGDAWRANWKVKVRCAWGKRDALKSIRECAYRYDLDMETLLWRCGPNFPLSRLESRLMCPRCSSRRVAVIFDVPTMPSAAEGRKVGR
jgi:hypothetical protein